MTGISYVVFVLRDKMKKEITDPFFVQNKKKDRVLIMVVWAQTSGIP
jgi:hypothetical protein